MRFTVRIPDEVADRLKARAGWGGMNAAVVEAVEAWLGSEGPVSARRAGGTTGPSVVPDTAAPMRPKSHAPVPGLKRAIDLLPVSEDVPPPGFPCGYQVRSGNCGQQATSYFGPQGRCDEHRGR